MSLPDMLSSEAVWAQYPERTPAAGDGYMYPWEWMEAADIAKLEGLGWTHEGYGSTTWWRPPTPQARRSRS